ncbi:hypothetical protein [Nocardia gipuzkoensis]
MTTPMLRVLSLGAGVQSTALALMACRGELPGLDGAIFADTGWEPAAVYAQVDRLAVELGRAGIPLYRVSNGNVRADSLDPAHRFVSVPYFTQSPDGSKGMARRQCTSEYKLTPINRKVRELLGAKAPKFRTVPKGRVAEQWIGFSTDEVYRVNDRRENRYTIKRYPLLELGYSRKDCERWLKVLGWGHTAKSACIGCPFHGNAYWRAMREHRPAEWADACDFDRRIRKGGASAPPLNGEAFLHHSRVPLAVAPIDRVTRNEWADRQLDIFDELAEQGDLDGCSPYGCRSGAPVISHQEAA